MALLSLRDVTISFGGAALLEGVSFSVEPGERIRRMCLRDTSSLSSDVP